MRKLALTAALSSVTANAWDGFGHMMVVSIAWRAVRLILRSMAAAAPMFIAAPIVLAQPASSLCSTNELVVFNCRIGQKIVSVCNSPDAGPSGGYLQYRFGSVSSLELTLPEGRPIPPRSAQGATAALSGGGGAWLSFSNGLTTYTVYTGIGKWGPRGEIREKSGIFIARGGKKIARLNCNSEPTSLLGPDWFDKMGVTHGDKDFFEFSD